MGLQISDGASWQDLAPAVVTDHATLTIGSQIPKGTVVYSKAAERFLRYYGATTGWRPLWNAPWGKIAEDHSSATTALAAGVTNNNSLQGINVVSPSFNTPANRLLKIEVTIRYLHGPGDLVYNFELRRGTSNSDPLVGKITGVIPLATGDTYGYVPVACAFLDSPSAGDVAGYSFWYSGATNAGASDLSKPFTIVVEDIGKNGTAPAD